MGRSEMTNKQLTVDTYKNKCILVLCEWNPQFYIIQYVLAYIYIYSLYSDLLVLYYKVLFNLYIYNLYLDLLVLYYKVRFNLCIYIYTSEN